MDLEEEEVVQEGDLEEEEDIKFGTSLLFLELKIFEIKKLKLIFFNLKKIKNY
jgi:hypothetical protein